MKMKLYTKTVCPKCMLIKNVLDAAGVEYEAINTDTDAEAKQEVIDQGFMSVPILLVNGEYLSGMPEIQKAISENAK